MNKWSVLVVVRNNHKPYLVKEGTFDEVVKVAKELSEEKDFEGAYLYRYKDTDAEKGRDVCQKF